MEVHGGGTDIHLQSCMKSSLKEMQVTREGSNSSLLLNLSARDRLDINVSTIFAELAMDLFSAFSTQGQSLLASERGSYAPYRIKNNTGSAIYVWSDQDGSKDVNELNSVHIENGQSIDWRFDDWKTMREVSIIETNVHMHVPEYRNSMFLPWGKVRSAFNSSVNLGIIFAVYL